jgi:hypothetical protein
VFVSVDGFGHGCCSWWNSDLSYNWFSDI